MTTDAVPTHADVVVIGAGTAGAALAGRLAARAGRGVVVLESGPDPRHDEVPVALADGSSLSAAYDGRVSDGLPVDLGDGRRSELRRGRVVGGSSAVNGAYFVRGRPEDFDGWAAAGDVRWSAASVLRSFERLEHDHDLGARPGHGAHGPVPVRREPTPSAVTEAFFAACGDHGHHEVDDLNSPDSAPEDGAGAFGIVPRNVAPLVGAPPDGGGQRVSSAAAYLGHGPGRDGARLLARRTARRVVLRDGRAVGVEVVDADGQPRTITADEVVLSAGAVGSAELLVRSGIGPSDVLRANGVAIVHDAPGVGSATFDHPCLDLMYLPTDGTVRADERGFFQGALHLPAGVEIMATRVPYGVATGGDPGDRLLSLRVTLTAPTSRGRIRWGADLSTVGIEHRSLTTEADRALARAGVRAAAGLAAHPAFAALVARWHGPTGEELGSDAALDAWIHAHLGTAFHLAGTAPMGAASDALAVVGPDLRVHGVGGLRVADASVMPAPLSRGPAATTVMIGEHAAAMFDHHD